MCDIIAGHPPAAAVLAANWLSAIVRLCVGGDGTIGNSTGMRNWTVRRGSLGAELGDALLVLAVDILLILWARYGFDFNRTCINATEVAIRIWVMVRFSFFDPYRLEPLRLPRGFDTF